MTPWKRADLHLHTSFSGWRSMRVLSAQDCYVAPEAAFRTALDRGMDFVAFTDHDTIDGALEFLSKHPEDEARVIVGEEVETRFPDSEQWIHVSVLDVDSALHRDIAELRPNCFELLAELEARRVLYALNHPFQSFRSIRAARQHLSAILPLFPAVEVCNSTSPKSHRAVIEAMLSCSVRRSVAWLGGSDAHTLPRIASVYTAAPAASKSDFLDSVRRGECSIGGAAPGLIALVRDIYSVIGEFYARVYRGPLPLTVQRLCSAVVATALLPAALGGLPAALTLLAAARQEWIGWGIDTSWTRDPHPLFAPKS